MLQVGEAVPDFELASDTSGEVKAAELRGKRFVLYFYPRDDTPGCTVEACSFRDNLPNFSSLDVPVYGISADDVDSHVKFRQKFSLTFPLLADPHHQIAEAFGTWVEKNNYGRKYMGIQRSTFVIGPDGRIEKVWEKVTPAEHVQQVLDYLRPEAAPNGSSANAGSDTTAAPASDHREMTEPTPNGMAPAQESVPESNSPPAEPAAHKTPARKTASKKAAAKKASAKKPAAKKAAGKKVARNKVAAKKTASKKTAAKKSAAKKTAGKKVAAKKTARR